MTFLPIIIGSDPNCYSAARSIHEAYGKKVQLLTTTVFLPFYRTKIADIQLAPYAKNGEIYYQDVFVEALNKLYWQHAQDQPDLQVLLYVPHEIYLQNIVELQDRLDFDPIIPYPDQELSKALLFKENFYAKMDQLGIPYPQTQMVDASNYQQVDIQHKVVIKADDNNTYKTAFDHMDKVFYADTTAEAHDILGELFKSYHGQMVIQQYIPGGEGSEYSISGYRASDGQLSMAQGRSILTDSRPQFIGNHVVICDSDRGDIYELSRQAIEGMDYYGFFNLDFKLDSQTGQPYVLEINPRLARSFYYSNLGGVNLLELAIEDLVFNRPQTQHQDQAFNWVVAGKKACGKHISPDLQDEYYRKDRLANTGHSILYEKDDDWLRRLRLTKFIWQENRTYFG